MYSEESLFFEELDTLSYDVQYQLNKIKATPEELADFYNEEGVRQFYKNKNRSKARAYFWYSWKLGNEHAHMNYINSAIVYRWNKEL